MTPVDASDEPAPEEALPTPHEELVEEERAKRSLVWPVALLVLLGLAAFLTVRGIADAPTGPDESTPESGTPRAAETAPRTVPEALGTPAYAARIGQPVRFRVLEAEALSGDSLLLVRGESGLPLLLAMPAEAAPGARDGFWVEGTVRAYPVPDTSALPADVRRMARRLGYYVRARPLPSPAR